MCVSGAGLAGSQAWRALRRRYRRVNGCSEGSDGVEGHYEMKGVPRRYFVQSDLFLTLYET